MGSFIFVDGKIENAPGKEKIGSFLKINYDNI